MYAAAFVKISLLFSAVSAVTGLTPIPLGTPQCVSISFVEFGGVAEFVDVDGSLPSIPFPAITTGDMSIAEEIVNLSPLPSHVNLYVIKAICVATKDGFGAPTCIWEADLQIELSTGQVLSGKFTATGSGPDGFSITGGTGDFLGAFGIVDTGGGNLTPTPCTQTNLCGSNFQPGDVFITFAARTRFCWYDF